MCGDTILTPGGLPLASSGKGSGVLLNLLECTGQRITAIKNYLAPNINCVECETLGLDYFLQECGKMVIFLILSFPVHLLTGILL